MLPAVRVLDVILRVLWRARKSGCTWTREMTREDWPDRVAEADAADTWDSRGASGRGGPNPGGRPVGTGVAGRLSRLRAHSGGRRRELEGGPEADPATLFLEDPEGAQCANPEGE